MQSNIWRDPRAAHLPGDWQAWLDKHLYQSEYKPAGREPEEPATSQRKRESWKTQNNSVTAPNFKPAYKPSKKYEFGLRWLVTLQQSLVCVEGTSVRLHTIPMLYTVCVWVGRERHFIHPWNIRTCLISLVRCEWQGTSVMWRSLLFCEMSKTRTVSHSWMFYNDTSWLLTYLVYPHQRL